MQIRSEHHWVTLIVVFLLLIVTVNSSQAQEEIVGSVYLNTLDGAVFAWNIQSTNLQLIVNYDYQFDRSSSGWSEITFSGDGQKLAYTRTDGIKRWIGISQLKSWQPVEFPIDVHFSYQHVRLNWLPDNAHLIVSYTVDIPQSNRQPATYDSLVGRQLLDVFSTSGEKLIDWPYRCDQLVILPPNNETGLRCDLDTKLSGDSTASPASVWYNFNHAELLTTSVDNVALPASAQDFIYPNWKWSQQGGLIFFNDGSHGTASGIYLVTLGSSEPRHLETNTTLFGNFSWSPDGTHVLIQDNNLRIWHIYDISSDQINMSVNVPDLNLHTDVVWFHDNNHIAYVTEDGQKSILHVKAISSNSDISLQIENEITALAVP